MMPQSTIQGGAHVIFVGVKLVFLPKAIVELNLDAGVDVVVVEEASCDRHNFEEAIGGCLDSSIIGKSIP